MEKKYTLCICYPTYNRSYVLEPKIREYFSICPDSRYCIRVQDNCSTDGSYERLQTIDDPRLLLGQNKENLGLIDNSQAVLYGNEEASYVLFSIDKDLIDPNYLSSFIDYLENERPHGGFIELYNPQNRPPRILKEGVEAIQYTGYLSKHPTGFFWRSDWLTSEMNKPFFKELPPKFDFWFDVMMAHCAVDHAISIVDIPLIMHGNRRKKDIKTHDLLKHNKTYYSNNNLYFLPHKRKEQFETYINDLLLLNIPNEDKRKIALRLLIRNLNSVTIELRNIYHHSWNVFHYNLEWQDYPWNKQLKNMWNEILLYNKLIADYDELRHCKSLVAILYTIFNMCKLFFSELKTSPKNISQNSNE